jgi:D-alanine transaminase
VVPVYGRRLFRFNEHMARLARSLERVRIPNPHGTAEWLERCRRVVAAQSFDDQLLYLQVTRGVAPRNHPMPPDLEPTVFLMSNPFVPPTPEQRHHGVACVTARDFRWEMGDIKNISLLANVLARQMAVDKGAAETIMFRDQGNGTRFLTEGSSSNVWIVHEGALLGPPKSELILEGIRVELLRELCEEEGIACNLRPIPEADVFSADEVLISSAARELLPVFARLHEAYQRAKRLQSI